LHPLAQYPGPFWASITDIWNVAAYYSGQQPYRLTRLHERYGSVVRYAPNRLSFTSADAVNTIYIKGSRTFPKTEFYDTFGGGKNTHLFIHKNPTEHAVRRRILLKSFSPQAIERYEPIIDTRLTRLRDKIRDCSDADSAFDLKRLIYLCVLDIISALMYGQDWNIQQSGEVQRMPDDHTFSLFNAVLGAWPSMHFLAPLQALIPHPQTGLRGMRNNLSYVFEALRYYRARKKEIDDGFDADRADVITSMITSIKKSNEDADFWNDFTSLSELLGFVSVH
jgi:cytochrome P450